MVKAYLLILVLCLLSACAPKKSTRPVKLKIFQGNLLTGLPSAGGVVVVGRSEDNLDSFRFALSDANQDVALDLKKGRWEFSAIAWSGENGIFTGNARCASSPFFDLKETETTVALNLSQANCLSSFSSLGKAYSPATYQNGSGNFYSLQPILCINSTLNSTNCAPATNTTTLKSYRFIFTSDSKGAVTGIPGSLQTNCRLVSDSSTYIKFPLGVSNQTSPYGGRMDFYPSTDCSGMAKPVDLNTGVSFSIVGKSDFALESYSPAQTSYFFHNPGAVFDSGSVQINAGAVYSASQSVSVSFGALPADTQDICITESASSTGCAPGDWITTLTSPQVGSLSASNGNHTLHVFARNSGLTTSEVGSDSITLDTTQPSYTTGGSYSSAYNSSALPISLSWGNYTDATAVTYDVKLCTVSGCSSGCTILATGQASNTFNLSSIGADGTYYVCIRGVDAAGNTSLFVNTGSFDYDTIPPTTTLYNLNGGANWITNLSIPYTASAGGASYLCLNESASPSGCVWNAYTSSGVYNAGAGEGTRQFYAHFKDNAGNISTTSDSIGVDTSAPTSPGAGTAPTFAKAADLPLSLNWSSSVDVNLDHYSYKICTTGDCTTSCSSTTNTVGVVTSGDIYGGDVFAGDSLYYLCVKGVDIAANSSSYSQVSSFTYDTAAPSASSFDLANNASYTNTTTVSFTAAATGSATHMCLMNSNTTAGCSWITYAGSGSYTLPAGDGAKTVYIFFKDAAGNESTAMTDNITLDTIAPTTMSITNPVANIDVEGKKLFISYSGGSDTNFYQYHVQFCSDSICAATVYYSGVFGSGVTAPNFEVPGNWPLNGIGYVVVKAEDLAGNFSGIVSSASVRRVNFARPKTVSVSYNHTCTALTDGKVKCWGVNAIGQLGTGSTGSPIGASPSELGDFLVPLNLGTFDATEVSNGTYFSCALSNVGQVKCWGSNVYAVLGQENTANSASPLAVNIGLDKPIQISSGYDHVCIVTESGDVKCWGNNTYGQLGIGSAVTIGDGPSEMGTNLAPVNLGTLQKAIKVSAGNGFTCALLSDRTVKCWGTNGDGQLGLDNTANRGTSPGDMGGSLPPLNLGMPALDISAGSEHACALLIDGNVKCWGDNSFGQLGYGDLVSKGGSAGSMSSLSAIAFGGRRALKISAGQDTTCAVLDDGEAACWGRNMYGNLGTGNASDSTLPFIVNVGANLKILDISTSQENTCAILSNGRMKCWGMNVNGRLGIGTSNTMGDGPGEMGDNLPYTMLGTSTSIQVKKIASGEKHNCALLYNGTVKCWGGNTHGQLALNTIGGVVGASANEMGEFLLPVNLGGVEHVRDIYSGGAYSNSTCALMADGELRCWGQNNYGLFGVSSSGSSANFGDETNEMPGSVGVPNFGGAKVRTMALGQNHSCVIVADGRIFCMGYGGYLGDNTSILRESPALIAMSDLGIDISVGESHSCALVQSGDVKCWGDNSYGQLGQNNTTTIGKGSDTTMASMTSVAVHPGSKAIKLSVGAYSSCALLDNHNVKCWGRNLTGMLGQDNATNISDGTLNLASASPVIFNISGALSKAKDMVTNGESVCVLKFDGNVSCWGSNTNGTLGRNDSVPEIGNSSTNISAIINSILTPFTKIDKISIGKNACAVDGLGRAVCWGDNTFGNAGQESGAANFGLSGDMPTLPIGL